MRTKIKFIKQILLIGSTALCHLFALPRHVHAQITPVCIGQTNEIFAEIAYDIEVSGNYAYLAKGTNGLRIYDISDPRKPFRVGYVNDGGTAYGITISGNYAYLSSHTNGVLIYDISSPSNPVRVAHLVDRNSGDKCVTILGNYLYLPNHQ